MKIDCIFGVNMHLDDITLFSQVMRESRREFVLSLSPQGGSPADVAMRKFLLFQRNNEVDKAQSYLDKVKVKHNDEGTNNVYRACRKGKSFSNVFFSKDRISYLRKLFFRQKFSHKKLTTTAVASRCHRESFVVVFDKL